MSSGDRWFEYCQELEDKLKAQEKQIQVLQGLILFMSAAPGQDRIDAYKKIMTSLDLNPDLVPQGVGELP